MKTGAEPDDTADYWEERAQIEDNITKLMSAKSQLHEIEDVVNKKEGDVKTLLIKSKKTTDNATLEKVTENIENERQAIEEVLNNAYDAQDAVNEIKTKMGEC